MTTDDDARHEPVYVDFRTRSRREPDPPAVVRRATSGPWVVVEIDGEMDLQIFPVLSRICEGSSHIVCDLHGVTFMDCSSLRVLADARRTAVSAGGSVRLAAPSWQARKILTLAGFERSFPTFDTVEEATTQPVAGGW